MLQWTWVYKSLFCTLLSVLLGIYQEVELFDNMLILFLIFWGTAILFPTRAMPFYIPINNARVSPHPHHTYHFLFFLTIANLQVVRQYLTVVLICISLITSDFEHFSYVYWPFLCLLWKNVSSRSLPIFELGCFLFLSFRSSMEKEMATHSIILAWRIPWMEKPDELQSTGSQKVGYGWVTSLCHFFER